MYYYRVPVAGGQAAPLGAGLGPPRPPGLFLVLLLYLSQTYLSNPIKKKKKNYTQLTNILILSLNITQLFHDHNFFPSLKILKRTYPYTCEAFFLSGFFTSWNLINLIYHGLWMLHKYLVQALNFLVIILLPTPGPHCCI